jgi:hypothetical protein
VIVGQYEQWLLLSIEIASEHDAIRALIVTVRTWMLVFWQPMYMVFKEDEKAIEKMSPTSWLE